MIISRTPFRISFLGGGTDYPEWFNEHGGAVLTTAINKYCHVGLRNGMIWSSSDLPMRSGMATSSAYTVGLLKTISKQDNKTIAQIATLIEREKLAGLCGYQDQYICALGGFRVINFYPGGITDKKIENIDWFSDYLLLFDSCHYRNANAVVGAQLDRMEQNEKPLQHMKELVPLGENALRQKDYKEFGRVLNESWATKKTLSHTVTTPHLDDIYAKAMGAGAIGGKGLGAGGGGFMIFVAEPDKHEAIKEALNLHCVSFKFDDTGSQIIYDDTNKPEK